MKDEFERIVDGVSASLQVHPKGPTGLTPDHIKATPQWKADRHAYYVASSNLKQFNTWFIKNYAKEWKATLLERRIAKRDAVKLTGNLAWENRNEEVSE